MLQKQLFNLANATQARSTLPLIISITQEHERTLAYAILEKHPHPLRGIALPQHLVPTPIPTFISYVRIYVDDLTTIPLLLTSLTLKKRLLEVFVPIKALQHTPALLKICEQAHRIVIELKEPLGLKEQQNTLNSSFFKSPFYNQLYTQFILMSRYPLFHTAPFCSIPPEHCYEFFDQANTIIPPKPSACNGCLFTQHCPLDVHSGTGKNFTPNPITKNQTYNDALIFLNRESTNQESPQKQESRHQEKTTPENTTKKNENTPARF